MLRQAKRILVSKRPAFLPVSLKNACKVQPQLKVQQTLSRSFTTINARLHQEATTTHPTETTTEQQKQASGGFKRIFKKTIYTIGKFAIIEAILVALISGACYAFVKIYHYLAVDDPSSDYYLSSPFYASKLASLVQFIEGIGRFFSALNLISSITLPYSLIDLKYKLLEKWAALTDSKNFETKVAELKKQKEVETKQKHVEGATKMLNVCLKNGGVYIKLGQQFANMRGLLPDEYCDVLLPLQDKVPAVPYSEVEKLVKRDFGRSIDELFSSFEKDPIAAASLAQVHRAVTKEGQKVAVKVQYPKVRYYLYGDLFTYEVCTYLMKKYYKYVKGMDENMLRMDDEENDIYNLKGELNFLREADYMKRVSRNFASRSDVYVPKVHESLTSSNILTQEFIDGVKITNKNVIEKEYGFTMGKVMNLALDAIYEQMFIHGFFHADPHSSNVFVRPNPKNPSEPQVVLLDHGLCKELSEDFRKKYAKFMKSIVMGDKAYIKEYCSHLGIEDYGLYVNLLMLQANDQMMEMGQDVKDKKYSQEEIEKWQKMFEDKQLLKSLESISKGMPKEMTLIMRADNLMRSINVELDCPVDRFSVIARVANRAEELDEHKKSGFLKRMWFEFKLRLIYLVNRFYALFFKFLMSSGSSSTQKV